MKLTALLEYLRRHSTTSDWAESLAQVFAGRGRLDLIPVPVRATSPGRGIG